MKRGRLLILIVLSVILILPAAYSCVLNAGTQSVGRLHIEPDKGNYLYIDRYDLQIAGSDKDGTTYFFLPSYVELSSLDLKGSPKKVFTSDESLLTDPKLGELQEVTVEDSPGVQIPWRICFMRSANIHTLYLEMKDSDPSDISKDGFSTISLSAYSDTGILEFIEKRCLIKGRGNATWDLGGYYPAKLPYEIRFNNAHGLGELSPEKKWVLLANAYEGTGILNKMVFDTARRMEMNFVPESDWADVYMNGHYLGNYLVCNEVQNSASALVNAGGCIIEKNDVYYDEKPAGFKTDHDAFTIKAPKPISDAFLSKVRELTLDIDACLNQDVPDTHLTDLDSFVKWYLLEEFFYNEDALITSCFFYTDHSARQLFAGPPWDFDGTCGEGFGEYLNPRGSILNEDKTRQPIEWYGRLYNDSAEFNTLLRENFRKYLSVYETLITSGIDSYYDTVHASMEMDLALYGRNGYGPEYTVPGYYAGEYNNIRFTKYFLYNRLIHLAGLWDEALDLTCSGLADGSIHTVTLMSPDGSSSTQKVPDGAVLALSSLPAYDPDEYSGWYYKANDLPVSPYLPVFEDITLYLYAADSSF